MKRHLLVIGAGGHAKVVIDAARRSGCWHVIGLLDDASAAVGSTVLGVPVLGEVTQLSVLRNDAWVVVAIGHNATRSRIQGQLGKSGVPLATVVHPAAVIADSVTLGAGCVVMAGVVVNADAVLGEGVILNTGATIDHDCRIGSFAHIAPGVHLCGGVQVGEETLLGVGASAIPSIEIGSAAIVAAGAVVVRNVRNGATVAGVPARETS